MTMFRFLVGLIGIPFGFLMLKYRAQVKDFTGNIDWAERYLGTGGTWSALTLIGLGISLFSFLYMIGVVQVWFWQFFDVFF